MTKSETAGGERQQPLYVRGKAERQFAEEKDRGKKMNRGWRGFRRMKAKVLSYPRPSVKSTVVFAVRRPARL
jgi:hypothetical protein